MWPLPQPLGQIIGESSYVRFLEEFPKVTRTCPNYQTSIAREVAPHQPRVPIGLDLQVAREKKQDTPRIGTRNVTGCRRCG